MNVIILAAGRSTRFNYYKTKVLYPIDNIPLLIHNIEISKQLHTDKPFIVVNEDNYEDIKNTLNDYNIKAKYVIQKNPNGIGSAISLFSTFKEDFVVILGDTYTVATNINEMINVHNKYQPVITTAAVYDDNIESVKRTCTVKLGDNNRIEKIYEKPDFSTGLRGCGLYVCNPKIFKLIEESPKVEFTNLMNLCDSRCVILTGKCLNINTLEDLECV